MNEAGPRFFNFQETRGCSIQEQLEKGVKCERFEKKKSFMNEAGPFFSISRKLGVFGRIV